MISFIDGNRQWFKSAHGLTATETPRRIAFCAYAINSPDKNMIVADTRTDSRFEHNPLVVSGPRIVFYAGVPLKTESGVAIGTLCVMDKKPRRLNVKQIKALEALSHQVMCQLELRKKNTRLHLLQEELVNNYQDMEQFAAVAAHDLRSPLHNITSLIDFFLDDNQDNISEDGLMYLNHIKTSSLQLTRLIDAILEYSKSTQVLSINKKEFNLNQMLREVIALINPSDAVEMILPSDSVTISASIDAMKQIFLNLINNAIKFNQKAGAVIKITFSETDDDYCFTVEDNGPGIPSENISNIFDLFMTVKQNRNSGSGIGLSIVKRLINKMHGDISVTSHEGRSTVFSFYIKKLST
jgi:signal transduction histidine kinase